jgi:hypothetical protein
MKIAHIGSTAVPGLAAKDIIDIQIGVHDLALDVRSKLSEAGYEFIAKHSSDHVPQGDGGIAGRWNKLYFHGRAGSSMSRPRSRPEKPNADAYYAVKDPVYDLVWHAANEWAEHSGWRHETSPES